jgi:hypothetical protein
MDELSGRRGTLIIAGLLIGATFLVGSMFLGGQVSMDQASYGSLAVTYRLPVVPAPRATPVPPKGWDPADDVSAASDKLVGIGQATTSVGIWLAIVGLPLLIGSAILLFGTWQIYRLARWLVRRREAALPAA